MSKSVSLVLLLFALSPVTACGTLAATGSQRHTSEYGFNKTTDTPSDAGISASIRNQLIKDAAIPANRISVQTEQGVVTLTGSVPSQAIKKRIIELSQKTKGVKRVESHLTVSPSP